MAVPLTDATVSGLNRSVAVPSYDRSTLTPGIVHIGVGGFHRAHQAMYLDRLLEQGRARDWAIRGLGVLPSDARMRDALTAQNGLYTLVVKHPDGTTEPRIIGSVVDCQLASDDQQAAVELLANPATRIVSLTITEGGYHVNPVTGEFDPSDPRIAADLGQNALPVTAFGYLTEALRRRRDRGISPFTVLSCDNIAHNGDVAARMLVAFATARDAALGAWIRANVPFPNSMVDRITPATTDADRESLASGFGVEDRWPVVCEPFTQWVIEDRFACGRPPWEEVGAQIVADVTPYELMKLRLLNASHQALCYFGYLAGYRLVHDVCSDELFSSFLLAYMGREARPTLPPVPGVDLDAYQTTLIERFSNIHIRDTVARLCAESSDRIPQWLLPVVRTNLERGGEIRLSAAIVASWARYAEAVDEQGQPIEVVDRLAPRLRTAARADGLTFLRDRELFGDLADDDRFSTEYLRARESLNRHGARATLRGLMSTG
ncbi:mannitol dehydrogenase [Actinophytocola xinjiangensis]|uniref:Mannitol-1-phosphate 5-dehydrogenase n=1 Tax=Actinophytocola xinjiangensis TaxID=485602 RepID=A0A7Z1AW12_9PSEU|nr:mannitol dehydrogenase family protein [Actinophytocola xinjiangensis]OLF07048.1 mannitol dehydrogenase [Actinophytocola xinjiangensis]